MRPARSLLSHISANPVARAALAAALFVASLVPLAALAFLDSYVNSGVTWANSPPAPDIPLARVNPMGINLFLEKEVERDKVVRSLDMAQAAGFKWIRQGFAWNDIEISAKGNYTDTRNPGKVVNAWQKYDFIVEQAIARGMSILARLDSPPVWARIPGDNIEQFHKGPPRNLGDYGDFAEAVATRYKGKVRHYQIWNEPNLYGEWGGHPVNAEEYTALLKEAYGRIKAVDPEAVVVSAALAPTTEDSAANLNDILYLEAMYRAGAAPYFDVMSTMLYGLGQPPSDRRVDLDRLSFSRPALLRAVMERNGDAAKPLWISEYAWISYPPDLQQSLGLDAEGWAAFQARNIWGRSVDEETQGRYLVEGYERARAEWPWMGVMFVWHLRNPDANPLEPATYFSVLRDDFSPRPAYAALQQYGRVAPATPQPREKPLWNAFGFPALYLFFGLLSLGAFAYLGISSAHWARAALNLPRGYYSTLARRSARDGAAIVALGLCFGLYYRSENLALVVAGLLGCLVVAYLKPQSALAVVAFAIPFFWYPKVLGDQRLPVAETLLLLAFAAFVLRKLTAYFLPALHTRFFSRAQAEVAGEVEQRAPGPRTTRPLPIAQPAIEPPVDGEDDLLQPARWPSRPTLASPLAQARPPLDIPQPPAPPASANIDQQRARASGLWTRFVAWNRADAFAPPAVALLVLGTLSLVFLANPDFARDSARAYRWTIVEPLLFYFLLTDLVTSKRGLLRVLDFFIAAGVLVSLIGLWQFAGGGETLAVEGVSRVFGVYQHPNNLALYLGRVAPFAACMVLFLPPGPRKTLYSLAALPLLATFALTFSRGAWVGAAAAILLAITAGLRWPSGRATTRPTPLFKAWLALVVLGAAAVAMAVAFLFPALPDRFLNPDSGVKRLLIWNSALKMIGDHPITGIGPDQFLNQYQSTNADGSHRYITPEQADEFYTSHPHNIVLDWWLSLGIMGLFVLLWLLARYYREAINLAKSLAQRGADSTLRAVALGLLASMTACVVHGLVDNSYFLMDLALIFWLSCGAIQLARLLGPQAQAS